MARLYFDERTQQWIGDYIDADGTRKRKRMGRTKTAATAVLRRTLDQVDKDRGRGSKIRDIRLSEIAKTFLAWTGAHRKPLTVAFYKNYLDTLEKMWSDPLLSKINRKMIDDLVASKRQEGAKPATVNRFLATLKRLFNKAIEWGHAEKNPVVGVKLLREDNSRVRYLDDSERKTLLNACPDWLKNIVEVAMFTGIRRKELFGLMWKDVDLARGQMAVRETKNSEVRYLPISSELVKTLTRIPKELGNPYVFARQDGSWPINFRKEWDRTIRRSGLKDFHLHDLRHTFASYLIMAGGADIKTVQELLGHKTLQMTLRYAHLAPEYKSEAVARMTRKVTQDGIKPIENGTYLAQAGA
jgi:integrase